MHTLVEEGDIVIIEFGRFEGGGPTASIRNNDICPGLDPMATCERSLSLILSLIETTLTGIGPVMTGKSSTLSSSEDSVRPGHWGC